MRQLLTLVKVVRLYGEWSSGEPTGHQISKALSSAWSRSTTYRLLKKAEKLNLIYGYDEGIRTCWFVTERGHEFLGAWNELPF